MCFPFCQLFTKGGPAGKLMRCDPPWDHLDYRRRYNIQRPSPLNSGRAKTVTTPRLDESDFGHAVTKCCIYNQFSVAFILHSIKAYFFTCSYFRILYSVLHLKDSSTSMRVKLDDLNSIHTLVQLNISERLHSSNKKLSFQITWRVFAPQWRNNF